MVLVCAWACSVGGDYGPSRPSYLVLPAGPSKQHKWAGYGYSDYLPLYVPKPYYIPKWIPHRDRTYTAFWVAHTPAPSKGYAHGRRKPAPPVGPKPIQGFGPLKGTSVVVSGGASHQDVAPAPPPPKTPLLQAPAPGTPLPLATLPAVSLDDPLTTYAPAPLGGSSSALGAAPGPRAASPPADPAFLPPKAEDVLHQKEVATNSVVSESDAGSSSYAHL